MILNSISKIMIQEIPKGVKKITSARSLQTTYLEILNEIREYPNKVIGISNKNDIPAVIMSTTKYESLLKLIEEMEEDHILEVSRQATEDYKNGFTKELTPQSINELFRDL